MERHRKLITPSSAALSRWLCSPCFVSWLFSDDILQDTKVNQKARFWLRLDFGLFFLSVEIINVPVLRYLLYPWSQRSGRCRRCRHCHHQRRGGTQQLGWQEGVLHLTLTRSASFLCWTANCGLLGWEVGVEGFYQAGFTPVQLKRRWGEGAAIETDGVWDGRALGELNFRPLHHPTPPAGAGFVQFKHLLRILCLVLFLLKFPLSSGHPQATVSRTVWTHSYFVFVSFQFLIASTISRRSVCRSERMPHTKFRCKIRSQNDRLGCFHGLISK